MHGYRGPSQHRIRCSSHRKTEAEVHYGVLEKQFRRFLAIAQASKGNTGNTLLQRLELRLDNVVRRMGVAKTIWASRQIVNHGHVLVDGHKVDIASFIVEPGMVITFREKSQPLMRSNMEQMAGHNVPAWIEWNPSQLTAKINALPTPDDVPFEVNMNLIIEFYR